MSRVDELARRRAALSRRAGDERRELAELAARVATPLDWIDCGSRVAGWLVARPWVAGIAAVGLLGTRPGRLLKWGGIALDVALLVARLRAAVRRSRESVPARADA